MSDLLHMLAVITLTQWMSIGSPAAIPWPLCPASLGACSWSSSSSLFRCSVSTRCRGWLRRRSCCQLWRWTADDGPPCTWSASRCCRCGTRRGSHSPERCLGSAFLVTTWQQVGAAMTVRGWSRGFTGSGGAGFGPGPGLWRIELHGCSLGHCLHE